MSRTFLDAVVDGLRSASTYNKNDVVAPTAILWPDADREWEDIVARVAEHMPILTLGPYEPQKMTGPAIWIRSMIARCLPEAVWPLDVTPVVYLPGYSRASLKAVDECPEPVKPLAELQFRGVIWSQKNNRDWTLAAFIQSAQGGLGVQVDGSVSTREALRRASAVLADEPVERLRAHSPLRAAFFNNLLTPDIHKLVLLWMNDPDGRRAAMGDAQWSAFRDECRRVLNFDPEKDGELIAAEKLGAREDAWAETWNRFREAPRNYSHLPELLRKAKPSQSTLAFDDSYDECWPQDNEALENELRTAFLQMEDKTAESVRAAFTEWEARHGERRAWVWSELGQSPLANALEHIVELSDRTTKNMGAGQVQDIALRYSETGWKTDAAALHALGCVRESKDADAVGATIAALYSPWLRDACESLQSAWATAAPIVPCGQAEPEKGVVYLFVDGLRLDLAHALVDQITSNGTQCQLDYRLSPVPSITETAKPAASPVGHGLKSGPELAPTTEDGSVVNITVLRKLLENAGFSVLSMDETGNPEGCAWTEIGRIDEIGHVEGWRLAFRATEELEMITGRVRELSDAGWCQIRIVTDHGWLLLHGGLPNQVLPLPAAEIRKGRCARLKPGAHVDVPRVPWFWDPSVDIAIAPGTKCFVSGRDYEHGGISPQELVVPEIVVTSAETKPQIGFAKTKWIGLKLSVQMEGAFQGMCVDLRTRAADPSASVAESTKPISETGAATIFCDNDAMESSAAVIVIHTHGQPTKVLAQRPTIIGGGSSD